MPSFPVEVLPWRSSNNTSKTKTALANPPQASQLWSGLALASVGQFSGKFLLRVPPGLHEALALKAEQSGKSLNAVTAEAIRSGLAVA